MTHHQAAALIDFVRQLAIHTKPDPTANAMSLILALGTLLTFVATAVMAYKTSQLAKETVRASAWADRHHQEEQSPIIFVRAAITREVRTQGDGSGQSITYLQRGSIENVGRGPAFNVRVKLDWTVHFDDWVIPLIEAGNVIQINRDRLLSSEIVDGNGPAKLANSLDVSDFTSIVDFTNIFGSEGHILQRKVGGGDLLVTETRLAKYVERSRDL